MRAAVLIDLGEHELGVVCDHVPDDDAPCLRAACRTLRDVDTLKARSPSSAKAYCASVNRARWAHSQGAFRGREHLCFAWAASHGSLDTLRWLSDQNFPAGPAILHAAATRGHERIVQWLLHDSDNVDIRFAVRVEIGDAAQAAAAGGHEALCRLLLDEARGLGRGTMAGQAVLAAAKAGRWGVVRRLLTDARPMQGWDHSFPSLAAKVASTAAELCHEEISTLEWLCGEGAPISAGTCASAAAGGNLAALQWLRTSLKCPWDATTCTKAAEGGHHALLKWAREHGCPWDATTCAGAALGGNLEILRWAREDDCPWDSGTVECAASRGHLHIVRWAREHGCPWSDRATLRAAEGGFLEVARWLTSQGCPLHRRIVAHAAQRGHAPLVLWALAQGARHDHRLMDASASAGSIELLTWGKENRYPYDSFTTVAAAKHGQLEALKWLRTTVNCPWTTATTTCAAHFGHFAVLRWAVDNGCPIDFDACFKVCSFPGCIHFIQRELLAKIPSHGHGGVPEDRARELLPTPQAPSRDDVL